MGVGDGFSCRQECLQENGDINPCGFAIFPIGSDIPMVRYALRGVRIYIISQASQASLYRDEAELSYIAFAEQIYRRKGWKNE